jgi:hypothetical protein
VAETAHVGLISPFPAPATNEKVKRMDLSGLDVLWLDRSDVTDEAIGHLATARCMSRLYVRGTRITEAGVKRLQQALPDCEIKWSPPTGEGFSKGDDGKWRLDDDTKHDKGPARQPQ